MSQYKYPRTFHLPWSEGLSKDDKVLKDTALLEDSVIVITEKMDGECTTIYPDGSFHARSLDSPYHNPTQWVVRKIAERLCHHIPDDYRVCGENLQITHSIHYEELPAFFLIFGIYNADNVCVGWDETLAWVRRLDVSTDRDIVIRAVPQLYIGPWREDEIRACFTGKSKCGGDQEGYVVRTNNAFPYDEHEIATAKFVRKDHVTAQHWRAGPFVPNKLR